MGFGRYRDRFEVDRGRWGGPMKKHRILLISGLLAVSAFAWGAQDQGQLSLAAGQGQRTKWEATDPEGDLVWGVPWRPKDAPYTLEIKAGTGKWKGIAGKGRLLDGESRRHDVRLGGQGSRRYHASP